MYGLCEYYTPRKGPNKKISIKNEPKLIGALSEQDKKLKFRPFNISGSEDSIVTYYNFKLDSSYILFDFDINVGDTLRFGFDDTWNQPHTRHIKKKDYFNGYAHYSVDFLASDGVPNYSSIWIEGVGSDQGLFSNYNWGFYELWCCTSNGKTIAGINQECDPDCPPRTSTHDEIDKDMIYNVSFYPNPMNEALNIGMYNNPLFEQPSKLMIYDVLTGENVFTTELINHASQESIIYTIDISQMPTGLLIVKVILDNGDFVIKKIVKK